MKTRNEKQRVLSLRPVPAPGPGCSHGPWAEVCVSAVLPADVSPPSTKPAHFNRLCVSRVSRVPLSAVHPEPRSRLSRRRRAGSGLASGWFASSCERVRGSTEQASFPCGRFLSLIIPRKRRVSFPHRVSWFFGQKKQGPNPRVRPNGKSPPGSPASGTCSVTPHLASPRGWLCG